MLIIVVGRGNGGTRLISDTLSKSGVYMGPVNIAGDLIPPGSMYKAAKLVGKYIDFDIKLRAMILKSPWSFNRLIESDPTQEFIDLINDYLKPILNSDSENKGWKIPETVLVAPWIIKMFPDAHYIYWTRDPRDTIVTPHVTDNLAKFNIPCTNSFIGTDAIESWVYQRELLINTPSPKNKIDIKFEDFVLNQDEELDKISKFLNLPLIKVDVDKNQVGDYKRKPEIHVNDMILKKYGYMI